MIWDLSLVLRNNAKKKKEKKKKKQKKNQKNIKEKEKKNKKHCHQLNPSSSALRT